MMQLLGYKSKLKNYMKYNRKTIKEGNHNFNSGDKVRIAKEYGGGTGIVADESHDSFIIVKVKGQNKSYHLSNLKNLSEAMKPIKEATKKSVSKAAIALEKLTDEMRKHVKEWKAATEKDKPKHLTILKQMTIKKKQLEKEVETSLLDLDKDVELKVTADMEEMKTLIRGMILGEVKKLKK